MCVSVNVLVCRELMRKLVKESSPKFRRSNARQVPFGRMAAPPPPRAIWQVDLASKEDPASPAYLAADRNPQRRQEYKQARASLPAAGLKMGTDINAHTASTWLPVQRNGEQLRSTRAK